METDLEICFVEQILYALMKLAPIRFLSILKMQYIIVKVLSFSVTLKLSFLICSLYSTAGIQLHLKEVFFDFHISEWSKPDQIRTPEPNMIFHVNFGLEIKYSRNMPTPSACPRSCSSYCVMTLNIFTQGSFFPRWNLSIGLIWHYKP